jgi:hypothetical protein
MMEVYRLYTIYVLKYMASLLFACACLRGCVAGVD